MTEYTHSKIAEQMVLSGYAKNFIAIALGMLDDRDCDLNGKIARYAGNMDALKRKAIHELDEIGDEIGDE